MPSGRSRTSSSLLLQFPIAPTSFRARAGRALLLAVRDPVRGLAHAQASEPATSLGSIVGDEGGVGCARSPGAPTAGTSSSASYTLALQPRPRPPSGVLGRHDSTGSTSDGSKASGSWAWRCSTNSFGQFSQYLYGGLQWRPIEEHQPFYVKVSAGLLHGYHGEYQDKIPFNHYGIAPAIVPSVGYCYIRYCGEFVVLGGAGALFMVGVTLP